MCRAQHASVLEGQAVVEDVAVRIEGVRLGVDHFQAQRRRIQAGFHIQPVREQLRDACRDVRLDQRDLVAVVDHLVEHAERLVDAAVGPIHRLQLETDIDAGGLRVHVAADSKQRLVQQGTVGAVCRQAAVVAVVARVLRIDGYAAFNLHAELDAAGPFPESGRRDIGLLGCCRFRCSGWVARRLRLRLRLGRGRRLLRACVVPDHEAGQGEKAQRQAGRQGATGVGFAWSDVLHAR